jgi:hypothetical protein
MVQTAFATLETPTRRSAPRYGHDQILVEDVRSGKEPSEHAQQIIRHAKVAGRTNPYSQLLRIRENIDPSLKYWHAV